MAVQELDFAVGPLIRSFRSARRWLWLQRGLRALAQSICAAAAFALIAALLTLFQAPQSALSLLWTAAALTPAAGVAAALLVRPREAEAVRIADFQLDLHQQLGTAHELLSSGSDGPLVPWQLSQASDLAEGMRLSRAFPLLPGRPLALAALLGSVAAGLLMLVNIGVVLNNPFRDLALPNIPKATAAGPEKPLFSNQPEGESAVRRSPALDSTRQMLDQIQKRAQRGGLSQTAAASALQQANAQLNAAAQQSLLRQQALDNLSTQLRDTAAGNEISQSLRQGDYQKAAQQIRDLGKQTDQLSAGAKQQLSQSLSNAATQSQGLQQLSSVENRASQSIQGRDAQQSSYSMDQLASAVEDAGKQVISQSELAQTWQQLNDLNKQLANGNQSASNASAAPHAAQPPDGSAEKSTSLQSGQPSDAFQAADAQGANGTGQDGGQLPGGGGSPGNRPGGPPLGNANPPLGADGKQLDVSGKIAGNFSGQPDSGNQPPSVTSEGDATSNGGQGQTASNSSSVPAENVFVPSDRRPIVRDYFSSGGGAGSQ